jgi:chromosome partitioning protein
LSEFGEMVAPPIASRSAFVRCFTTGQSVASFVPGDAADQEIQQLADAVEWAAGQE